MFSIVPRPANRGSEQPLLGRRMRWAAGLVDAEWVATLVYDIPVRTGIALLVYRYRYTGMLVNPTLVGPFSAVSKPIFAKKGLW